MMASRRLGRGKRLVSRRMIEVGLRLALALDPPVEDSASDTRLHMSFRVDLDIFRGPLDLLLYLVRKHEVEVAELPVAPIAEQFLEHLEVLQQIDVDLVGDFLDKPHEEGGLALSRYAASAALIGLILIIGWFFPSRPAKSERTEDAQ